jgi:hypothetical protein
VAGTVQAVAGCVLTRNSGYLLRVDGERLDAARFAVENSGMAGFVSSRAGNYQESPVYGPLLDQMWVR